MSHTFIERLEFYIDFPVFKSLVHIRPFKKLLCFFLEKLIKVDGEEIERTCTTA